MEDMIAKKFSMIKNELNERQRRLWAASEAMSLGYGGVSKVSRATGISKATISQGIKELESGEPLDEGRVRQKGGGRKKATETQPGLKAALKTLVEPTAKGSPQSPLCWTTKSTRQLSVQLKADGFKASSMTVCTLLHESNYRLSGNRKTIEGGDHPDRDAQFALINAKAAEFLEAGQPVISVDAKKKELIGNYKQNGRTWRPKGEPELVNVYDFPDKELGKATPYGVYDMGENTGWVNVGVDHDTAEFAVESIRRWWKYLGKELYPDATELYITADGGGSNGRRNRLWKHELQQLSDETGMTIHVSHFPPGTSKWNKIEHRLFNHISMNWKGRPLTSLDVIIELIAATTSRTGLKVYAMADLSLYPTGRKISDSQMAELHLLCEEFHGEWNYIIQPRYAE